MDGRLKIDELITHQLKLEDINQGFELMKRGESIRSVVMF
jgi:S-(hydroxymethyl)glutathione dehydrogenase/alcohol dehydrogenase